jgi:hypothetical protein
LWVRACVKFEPGSKKKYSHTQLAMVISQHKWIVPHTTTCHPPPSYLRLKYQFTPKSSISLSKHEMNLCYWCARTLSFSSKPQGPAAAVGVVGAGNARAVTPPGPELLAPHPAKEAPCWLCCCLSGVTLAPPRGDKKTTLISLKSGPRGRPCLSTRTTQIYGHRENQIPYSIGTNETGLESRPKHLVHRNCGARGAP